jgi:hypothetical protein
MATNEGDCQTLAPVATNAASRLPAPSMPPPTKSSEVDAEAEASGGGFAGQGGQGGKGGSDGGKEQTHGQFRKSEEWSAPLQGISSAGRGMNDECSLWGDRLPGERGPSVTPACLC